MKAISFEAPLTMRKIEIGEPSAPGPQQVLVKIHRVGVCGTDFAGYLGKMPFFSYPRIPGHELGVEVVAVGEGVSHIRVGDRCAVEPYINCQKCYSCKRGLTNCCESHQTLGVMCDGGMTELMLLPARKLHVENELSYEQLALVETLAIGCHAVNRAAIQSNHHVLIIGAGPIGLSALEFVKLTNAHCMVMDINQQRLEFVRDTMKTPDIVLLPTENGHAVAKEAISQKTECQMADVVIDATGNANSMSLALEYCAFGGKLVFVGITQQSLSFPHAPVMHRRELTLLASRNALAGDFTRILGLIRTGQIDTKPWITHHGTMDQLVATFPEWLKPEKRVIKAMVAVAS